MRTNPLWHGVRLRHFLVGADPDAPPRRVMVPAGWDASAAAALAALAPGEAPIRLPDAAEPWIRPVARDPGYGEGVAARLHAMLLHRLGAPAPPIWQGDPALDPRFILNLAAFVRPGMGFDQESLAAAVAAAVASVALAAPDASCVTVAIADLAGMLAALGIDYGGAEARSLARDTAGRIHDAAAATGRTVRLGAFTPGPAEALLGIETGGIAPAFAPVGTDGALTRTARTWLAARGLTGEAALAAQLAGDSVFPQWDAAAHAAMHDALAPLLEAMPARPVIEVRTAAPSAQRRELPARHAGYTQKAAIGGHRVFLRTGEHPDGTLGEISIALPKDGPATRGLMDAFAAAVSLGLQYGVPLEEFVEAFTQTRFGPSGPVEGDAAVPRATSIPDYVFRHLAANYLGRRDIAEPEAEDTPAAPPLLPLDLPADPRARRRGLRVVRG